MYWLQRNAEWVGWLSVWLYVGITVTSMTVAFIVNLTQRELPDHYLNPIEMAISNVLLFLFLYGVRGFAVRKSDTDMTKTLNTLIFVNILEMVLLYPFILTRYIEQDFQAVLLIALVPVLCIHGIILLRLAENFNKHVTELGPLGKRIVLWNKIAGWMLASVVLIIPGLIVAIIAFFFLWRLLARSNMGVTEVSTVSP